jgi:N-acetyl sugar amidotransferase
MDETDPNINFDEQGVCNYCREAEIQLPKYKYTFEQEKENLEALVKQIKSRQKGEYDSILGLSGGVDSSYLAYLAWKHGLNPLCVHFDNGWNSETAVKNIRNIIDTTGFDLSTYVIDWPEFRDLQRAFVKAGVIDIEMLTDHAIFAALFRIRRANNIATVLSGTNYATEHGLPTAWRWPKTDLRNIKAIQKKYGAMKIKSFPTMSTFRYRIICRFGFGGVQIDLLNKVNYMKKEAMKTLSGAFDWEYYGGKHYESLFTKFYQAYILPTKFGVDKRKSHLSALLRNGEITRDEAVEELKKPPYDENELARDKKFVLKKLGFSETEFEEIMNQKPIPHDHYATDRKYMNFIVKTGKSIFGGREA